jgi:hypothetical protein
MDVNLNSPLSPEFSVLPTEFPSNVSPLTFLEAAFAISESGIAFSDDKRNSIAYQRRIFDISCESEETDISRPNTSPKQFGLNSLNEATKIEEDADNKINLKSKKKKLRRSISLPQESMENLSRITLHKKTRVKKLTSSEGMKYADFPKLPYSDRELIQPITARENSTGSGYRKASIRHLDDLPFIDESKESQFNKKTRSKLRDFLEANKCSFPIVKTANELQELAQRFFDNEISSVTRSKFQLRRTPSCDLISSELSRAQSALREVQKSMVLLKNIIPRLQFLQNSIYKVLTRNIEKKSSKTCYKSHWINNFFTGLDGLICSYSFRKQEMNPLKTFTHIYTDQLNDKKMKDLIFHTLKIEHEEFDKIMSCLNFWADSKKAIELTERVSQIDRKNIINDLDFSTDRIAKQRHEWFESLDSPISLSKNRLDEIVRCLIPTSSIIFKDIKVNDKSISLKGFSGNTEACQIELFTRLIHAIYSSGFDPIMKHTQCEDQARVLVNIHNICSILQKDLSAEFIPWEAIQKKLSTFPAIPFLKFKNRFNKNKHLDHLDQFLINLTIPCINILKLCTNDCWSWGHDCISCLFTDLFHPYGDKSSQIIFHTRPEKGIYCHINIKSQEDFSVTQIKRYGTYPRTNEITRPTSSLESNLEFAKTTFKWTLSPYKDDQTQIACWRGLLEIPHVEINEKTPLETKKKILKILNNPNIVDYVMNSLTGKPKIITTQLD